MNDTAEFDAPDGLLARRTLQTSGLGRSDSDDQAEEHVFTVHSDWCVSGAGWEREPRQMTILVSSASTVPEQGKIFSTITSCTRNESGNPPVHLLGKNLLKLPSWKYKKLTAISSSESDQVALSESAQWLDDALRELSEADEEAKENGYELPKNISKGHALHILRNLADLGIPQPIVYPTEDCEIAIQFSNPSAEAIVLILCDARGCATCFVSENGSNRDAFFHDASMIPDPFVENALIGIFEKG